MLKKLFLLTITVLFSSCTVTEKPEFIGIDNIQIVNANLDQLTVSADAQFNNPNSVSGTLSSEGILVIVNEVETATLSSKPFEVPAKKEFSIPLVVSIPTDSVVNKRSLGGLLNSIFAEKIKVTYKGKIDYNIYGFSHSYKVDRTEDIKLKL